MLAFSILFSTPLVLAAPLFGLGSDEATGAPTPMSLSTVNATLLRPRPVCARCVLLQRFDRVLGLWSALRHPRGRHVLAVRWRLTLMYHESKTRDSFHSTSSHTMQQTKVLSLRTRGPDPDNILSLLNDAEFALVDVDTARIPQAAGTTYNAERIKVHSGFQSTFQRTADGLLAGVQDGLQSFGVKKVVVTGHSLGSSPNQIGAALATDDRRDDQECGGPVCGSGGYDPSGSRAGGTRLGRISSTRMSASPSSLTKTTPSRPVPPLLFGYTHSQGEIHIVDGSQTNIVACPGHDNKHCTTGNSLLHLSVANHLGPYFDDITFGSDVCSS
ncbi:hypothetical protein B0H14DRAFT_2659255 [Mycena olivaceomarginata]|nr:hypothetical protein B0H14DRAFT_2659255 [Mycena olivaceomarginata]